LAFAAGVRACARWDWSVLIGLAGLLLISPACFAQSVAQLHRVEFEGSEPVARLETRQIAEACTSHVITTLDRHSGKSCEQLLFRSAQVSAENERILIAVPESRVFNELTASVWIRTNCSNVRLGMRVRFPHQIDPRTQEPLAVDILGELSTGTTEWQQIQCQTTDEAVRSRLIRARGQLANGVQPVRLDDREPYVDRLVFLVQLPQGDCNLELDDLEYGPIVKPESVIEPKPTGSAPPSQLTILDDRIRKNGRPFFPIFTLYHGESLELISRTGVNLLWIRSYLDRPLLSALAGMEIGAIAYPPQPSPEQAILDRAAIPSLPEWTSPIWAWILGFEIPREDRAYVTAWADQIRDADRQRRPILADVSGDERDFHRHIDFLAGSRFAIHTGCSNPDHFEELRGRRDFALPGKPMFTFLQTEASGPMLDYFADRGTMPIVEPEQILHQAYEAVAAGYKGVGFWKQIPFDNDVPGLNERLDAIRIFSIHGRILEPFLATARVVNEISVQVDDEPKNQKSKTPLASRWDRRVTPAGQTEAPAGVESNIAATVFHTEHGLLILLVWHEPGAQCVPGPQAAKSVKMLVQGIGDVAQAWEVTPTGIGQKNLTMTRVAGGTELTLEDFDQAAAIIVTSDKAEAEALQPVVRKYRRIAAEAFVQLASNKLTRVTNVHLQLVAVGSPTIPQADVRIQKAQEALEQARQELAADRMDEARVASQKSLQWLRSLQRAHWEAAVDPLIAPTASLAAASFQTLPEHWRMLTELGQAKAVSGNVLPSGDFEGEQSLAQWSDGSGPSRFSSLRLATGGIGGGHHLSMLVQGEAPPGRSAVLVSPPITTQKDDLVVITGRFRLPVPLVGPGHQFSIFDTMVGRGGAIRLKEQTENWTAFRMVRRDAKGEEWRLRFELEGPGIAELDDIQVRVVQAGSASPSAP
jgi:hypothetical protein